MKKLGACVGQAVLLIVFVPLAAAAPDPITDGRPTIDIPRLARPPTLEAFLGMAPQGEVEQAMTLVSGLIQQIPNDGQDASQKTDVYLGYDDEYLYAVFVAFDDDVEKMRANLTRRESFFGDDLIEIMIDTFNDQRRAYAFVANPFGVQWDAIWREGQEFDSSFDTLWHSKGEITDRGYVVHMAIPFKSLRFPSLDAQACSAGMQRRIHPTLPPCTRAGSIEYSKRSARKPPRPCWLPRTRPMAAATTR